MTQKPMLLDGIEANLSREDRVRQWLRENGWTLERLGREIGVGHSYLGKALIRGCERLTPERRGQLTDLGFPEELLP